MKIEVTEKELAMICDALWTTASSYRRDMQQFYRTAAESYDALARRLSDKEKYQGGIPAETGSV